MNTINKQKKIAIVVDESKRTNLIEWSYFNKEVLSQHEIIANEITADLLKGTLNTPVSTMVVGTLDGYRELTQMIENKDIDILIFFGDPVKVDTRQIGISDLLAFAIEQNIMIACNLTTADLIIGSLALSSGVNTKSDHNSASLKSRRQGTVDNRKHEMPSIIG